VRPAKLLSKEETTRIENGKSYAPTAPAHEKGGTTYPAWIVNNAAWEKLERERAHRTRREGVEKSEKKGTKFVVSKRSATECTELLQRKENVNLATRPRGKLCKAQYAAN